MVNQIYLTKQGLNKLKKELDYLTTTKRKEITKRIQEAKELGDLSENADYTDAKDEQAFIEGRILELKNKIKNAIIIQKKINSNGKIEIGSIIKIKDEQNKIKEYQIVGKEESDPSAGKISNESPIGKAFLGKKSGEVVEFQAPKGIIKYKIIKVS